MLGMDFGALPPEINSARLYAGPGSAPMMQAAATWERLATELNATAASYASVLSGLTGQEWLGPASVSMAAAAAPYVAWMRATAVQAEQAAAQALTAANAYESAYAETVPPAAIAANRSTMMSLIQTNIFGQNTPAIATSESYYGEMWAQDIVAMEGYAGTSAAASDLTPFSPPPATTTGVEPLSEALTTPAAAAAEPTVPAPAASIPTPIPGVEIPIPGLEDLDILVAVSLLVAGGSLVVSLGQFTEDIRHDEVAEEEVQEELGGGERFATTEPVLERSLVASRPGSAAAVEALAGHSTTVGGLSVPQSWSLPPAVRQVAAMFPGTTPLFMTGGADGSSFSGGSSYAGMAAAGLAAASMAGLAGRGADSSSPSAAAGPPAGGGGAAATKPAANTPAIPAAATAAHFPGLPQGLPPGVVANLAATLAAIPGATIIVVPPNPNQ